MSIFQQDISEFIWDQKYRYRWEGKIIDSDIEATWNRVARAIAKAEKTPKTQRFWHSQFLQLLSDFKFIPGGRILAGAGTRYHVTLLNCYVMGVIEDSLTGIFQALTEAAMTLQQGGGVGFDFSSLRPKGSLAHTTGNIASGPVSFMRIWDAMSATMQSTGARRGAMMGTLRCDHPDIEIFISAKREAHELRNFNVSVLVTDEFMRAVKADQDWELVFPISHLAEYPLEKKNIIRRRWSAAKEKVPCVIFKKVKARVLWDKIIKSAYQYAEPGVIFEDTMNRQNNLAYREWLSATNPCAEIPLPPYGACNLGSFNLTQYVTQAFSERAYFNWDRLSLDVITATRFLDNVLDVSRYPLRKQKQVVMQTRRIGIGITGLADAMLMLGMQYGHAESLTFSESVMRLIAHTSWQASAELSREKGAFPSYQHELYRKSPNVKKLPKFLRDEIARLGMRNSHHTAIAPTGTISLLANNISNSIEPIFHSSYERQVRTHEGVPKVFRVQNYAIHQWGRDTAPPHYIDAQQLKPIDHLHVQAAIQPYIDNAISKTIFIPEKFPFKKLQDIYSQAYELGLKGCTIFRPNPITGSILTTGRKS